MAPEGQDLKEHLEQKYRKDATANFGDPNSRLMKMGRSVGIHFNMSRRMVNTIRAHALVEAVKEIISNEMANKVMEHLYDLYFNQGKDISDSDILLEVAHQVAGMDPRDAALALETGAQDIHTKDRRVKSSLGVSGVPYYIIHSNDKSQPPVAFSGAYPPEIIAEHLKKQQ